MQQQRRREVAACADDVLDDIRHAERPQDSHGRGEQVDVLICEGAAALAPADVHGGGELAWRAGVDDMKAWRGIIEHVHGVGLGKLERIERLWLAIDAHPLEPRPRLTQWPPP